MCAMYEQPVLTVADPAGYRAVKTAIEGVFSVPHVEAFLRSLERNKLRIRDFEAVLSHGLLGNSTQAGYAALGNSDQGQIREFYLASLDRISPELRNRFFKLYAYY